MTHREAHRLIELNADEALSVQEKSMLATHLKDCGECRAYVEEIKELESILVPLMKKHWDFQPIPLSRDAVSAKRNSKTQMNILLATRIAAIGAVLLAFIFSAWQFTLSSGSESGSVPVGSLAVPTPSTQSTSTMLTAQDCNETLYIVRENDTLESIARQFAVSKEELMAINDTKTELVTTNMELMIPICHFTPTSTVHPMIFSTRYTPSTSPTTSTPGPSG